jgi:hypothetical protein
MSEQAESTVLLRRKASLKGEIPKPHWDGGGVARLEDASGICLCEEILTHPEQEIHLCLYQMDDDGELLGEIWLTPTQLATLVASLSEELRVNYTPGVRRWNGDPKGPWLNYGSG